MGTTRTKAALVDAAGRMLAVTAVATPFAAVADGVEMTAADLERAVAEAVAALPAADRARVAGVGVAGLGESGVPLAGGAAAAPILAWFDGRGGETAARLAARFGDALPARTGQRIRSVSSVAKLGWLLDHGLAPPDRWLGVPETVLRLLTGAEVTEHSLASRTGAYDVTGRVWIPEVLSALGLPAGVFGDAGRAGEAMGAVTAPAAGRFGLPAGVPVTLAGHDHLAGAEAVGADLDDALNSVGTAETVLRRSTALPDLPRALEAGVAVTVRPGGDGWVALASAVRSGQVLAARSAELGFPPEELDRRLERSEPPGPQWGETLRDLAARTVAAAGRLASLLGPAPRLVVYGGGSRSRPWLEAKAELAPAGTSVLRSGAAEAAARGAALAGGVAAGWWPAVAATPAPPLEPVPAPAGR